MRDKRSRIYAKARQKSTIKANSTEKKKNKQKENKMKNFLKAL